MRPFFRQLTSVGLIQNEFGPIFVEKNKHLEFIYNFEENKIDLLQEVSCRATHDSAYGILRTIGQLDILF